MSIMDTLVAARSQLMFMAPFIASLALRLNMETHDKPDIIVDGETLKVPENMVLSSESALPLVARAALHCGLGHPFRRNGREQRKWNEACRLAVEIILEDSKMMRGADRQWDGFTAEQIYDRLDEDEQSSGKNGKDGEAGPMQVADGKGGEGGQKAQEWKGATLAAAEAARVQQAGKLAASIERMLELARRVQVPWRTIVRDFIMPISWRDYTWQRPSRRFIADGLYLPGITVTDPGPFRVLVDASGSVSQRELGTFMAEVRAIQDELRPEAIIVSAFDTNLKTTRRFEQDEPVNFTSVKAGGGTDYRHLWHAGLEERDVDIVITDGYCDSFPKTVPDVPVLWLVTGTGINKKFKPPFGRAVIIPELR